MEPGYFDDGSAIRDIASEPFVILGGGPALLLQPAHTKVAPGVAEHSGFRSSPFPRLFSTVAALRVSDAAREQARAVLFPALWRWLLYPAALVFRLVTTGLLPEPIRTRYALPWTPRRERLFRLIMRGVRLVMNLTVRPVRKLPIRVAVLLFRRFRWSRYRLPDRPARRTPRLEEKRAG